MATRKKKKVSAKDILKTEEINKEKTEQKIKSDSTQPVTTSRNLSTNHKWYVLNIQSGYESSVAKAIKQRVEASKLEKKIKDILLPTQKKIVVKEGKQDIKEEKIFPGYILINMKLSPTTWELITNIDGVKGFVRTDKYPRPLPQSEVDAIMKFMEVEQPAYQASFSIGEAVKITEGAFADFIGSVQEINAEKGKVKVLVSFLGREAPVEVEFSQVAKL
ncbi:MAG TPA: transcription termination/antitermination factor NusG [bacterium]|nr:transcription termination/antitermination factor NusG [bacterium]